MTRRPPRSRTTFVVAVQSAMIAVMAATAVATSAAERPRGPTSGMRDWIRPKSIGRTTSQLGVTGARKYEQSIDCSLEPATWYSNFNTVHSPYVHVDDFRCELTGDVTVVSFRGGMWNVLEREPCPTDVNLHSIEITFFEWWNHWHCDWQPGKLLCTNTIPVEALDPEFVCIGRVGEEIHEFSVTLPHSFAQVRGRRYGIRIAATLNDPEALCLFYVQGMVEQREGLGYSFDLQRESRWCNTDTVFSLLTRPANCPADFDSNGSVELRDLLRLLAAWGNEDVSEDLDGNGFVDAGDLVILLASWGPY